MRKKQKSKFISMILSVLIIIVIFSTNAESFCIYNPNIVKNNKESPLITSSLTCDLKIKISGEDWQDTKVSTESGDILEFKGTIETTRSYKELYISFLLSDEDTKLFNYMELSASPIPSLNDGIFFGNNDVVLWTWFDVNSGWDEEMTFRAKVKAKGSINVVLNVVGIIDEDGEEFDESEDSVEVSSSSGGSRNRFLKNNFRNFIIYLMQQKNNFQLLSKFLNFF
jgi:hypothetical protein